MKLQVTRQTMEQIVIAAEKALDEKLVDFAIVFNIDRPNKTIMLGLLRDAKNNIVDGAKVELLKKGEPKFLSS